MWTPQGAGRVGGEGERKTRCPLWTMAGEGKCHHTQASTPSPGLGLGSLISLGVHLCRP